jgi:hypothetical protein
VKRSLKAKLARHNNTQSNNNKTKKVIISRPVRIQFNFKFKVDVVESKNEAQASNCEFSNASPNSKVKQISLKMPHQIRGFGTMSCQIRGFGTITPLGRIDFTISTSLNLDCMIGICLNIYLFYLFNLHKFGF